MTPTVHPPTPPDRLKVMQLVDVTGRGGAERVLVDLALRLDRRKFEVMVGVTRYAGDYQSRLNDAGVATVVLNRRSRAHVHRLIRLAGILRRNSIHILHCHLFGSNQIGRLVGSIAGVPIIVSHEHWSSRRSPEILIDRLLYRLSDAIIVSSEASKRLMTQVERIPANSITVVHNGVDPADFQRRDGRQTRLELGYPDEAIVIGTVARLARDKRGQDDLLRAFAEIRSANADARLLVVGDGPLKPTLEALAAELGVQPWVSFVGKRNDVPRLLHAMDLFVLPSHVEAFPMAVLEAMAAGLPVVATDVGGIPEIIDDGKTGLLVPAAAERALSAAIERLSNDAPARRRLGQAGQLRVREDFTIDRMVSSVEQLYGCLAERKLSKVPHRKGTSG